MLFKRGYSHKNHLQSEFLVPAGVQCGRLHLCGSDELGRHCSEGKHDYDHYLDHCDDGCDVYDRDGQVNPITVNMVVWKFAITDNSLLCLCVLFLMRLYVFVYLDVSSYNMRRRIIDRQTIQKSS